MSMSPPPPPPPPGPQPYPGGTPMYAGQPEYGRPGYAGFGSRLVGYLLDGLIYGLLLSVFAVPGAVLLASALEDCDTLNDEITCTSDQVNAGPLVGAIALFTIGFVLVAVLYIRALGRTGQTWGRKIAGVKVVGKDSGQPLGAGKAFLRVLVASLVSGNCILGYLWMLWDRDKQTWHDKIVSSVVVKV